MADSRAPISYTDIFVEHLPFYISIGMTPEQYWDGESTLVIAYREAYKLRQQETNRNLWLQGLYIYEALCCVSPIFRAFAKNGTKPIEYRDEPIALTKKEAEERRKRDERRKYEAFIADMKAWAKSHNEKLSEQADKEVSDSGRRDN